MAPYSTRARRGATVATPLTWDELTETLDPATFNIGTVPRRLQAKGDPWRDMQDVKQALPKLDENRIIAI